MWHEARKQEKKIRSLMVDYRKRADRRREFYQKIKLDPAQFLRIYGRPAKIHLENSVAIAAESPQSMMPWQGDTTVTIDRFDVRAHLDYIPEVKESSDEKVDLKNEEERNSNYERYRILVQNECAQVSEEQCLQQIFIDEMFGGQDLRAKEKEKEAEKKKLAETKAAISYTYSDPENGDKDKVKDVASDAESEESVDSDMDLDAVFDVDKLTTEQTNALNEGSVEYGMEDEDFFSCMWQDKEEAEELRLAKIMEEEKAQYSGRKSRRERRAYKEKKLKERGSLSPPSYAAKRESPVYEPYRQLSSSRSRSPSPKVRRKKTFILSFGGSDDEGVIQGPELPPHLRAKSDKVKPIRKSTSPPLFKEIGPQVAVFKAVTKKRAGLSMSRSRSSSKSKSPRQKSHQSNSSRSRSRSRKRSRSWKRRSYSSSSSRSRSRSSDRSRSRSRRRFKSRSRSRSSRSRSRDSGIKALPQFRHRRSVSSSTGSTSDSDDNDEASSRYKKSSFAGEIGKKGSSSSSKIKITMQERMKKKMKKVLTQQYKADKKARLEKQEKEEQDRQEREEELRNMAIELRRKEREKRHLEQEDLERMEAVEKRRRSRSTSKTRVTKPVTIKRRSSSKSRRSRSPVKRRSSSSSRRSDYSSQRRTSESHNDYNRDLKTFDRRSGEHRSSRIDQRISSRAPLRLTHSGEYKYTDGREHRYTDSASYRGSDSRKYEDYSSRSSSGYRGSNRSHADHRGYRDRTERSDDRKQPPKLVDY